MQVDGKYPGFTKADPATELTRYEAVLNNCYFRMTDGAHRQYIAQEYRYYTLDSETVTGLYAGEELTSTDTNVSLTADKIGELIDSWGTVYNRAEIKGYYLKNDDGTYQQAYAWSTGYYNKIYYVGPQSGNQKWSSISGNPCKVLYTFSSQKLENETQYLLLSGDTAFTANGTFEVFTESVTGFWDLVANPKFVLTASGENQITIGGQVYTVTGNNQMQNGYTVTAGGISVASDVLVYKLTGPSEEQTTGVFTRADKVNQSVEVDTLDPDVTGPDKVPTELPPATMSLTPVQTAPAAPIPAPTEPATEPTEPATEPTEPATEPTEPATEPTEPATEPTEPATEPTEPVTEPTEPATEPTEPATEPTKPAAEPTEAVSPASEPEETPPESDDA